MSDTNPETTESAPAATALPKDSAVDSKQTDSGPKAGEDLKKENKDSANGAAQDNEKPTTDNTDQPDENGDESKSEEPSKKRKYGEDDPRNKYRTHGLKNRGNLFDPSVQEDTDDPIAIRKQVEFYFSDSNLARDKFLYDKVEGPKNTPIEIKTLHSFKRMRRFQPYEAVVKALKDSTILEVTEDEKVKRKDPLPADFENKTVEEIAEVVENQSMARSVYVKGFGMEKPTTQFDLEAWFSRFGETNAVRLRRADDKSFKGSVFVEFNSEETAQKFMTQEPKPTYDDRELLIMTKKAYCDEKVDQIRAGKLQPSGKPHADSRKHRSDDRDWRDRRDDDQRKGFRDNRQGGRGSGRGRGRGRGRGQGGNNNRRERQDRDRNARRDDDGSKEQDKEGSNKRARTDDDGDSREAKKEKLASEE